MKQRKRRRSHQTHAWGARSEQDPDRPLTFRVLRGPLVLLGCALLLLGLAACAGNEPTLAPTAPSIAPAPTDAPDNAAPPTDQPPEVISSPEPPAPGSPWPRPLRTLDLSIPAGNSYGPRALAIDPGQDLVYVHTRSRESDAPGRVAVLRPSSGEVQALIETGRDAYGEGGLLLDAERGRLLVVNADESNCSVHDTGSRELLTTIEGASLLALSGDGNRLYVAGAAGLRVLDATDYVPVKETSVAYAPRFLALELDKPQGRVYLAYEESGTYTLAQFDASTLALAAATELPGRPQALAADAQRGLAYLTLSDGDRNLLWTVNGDGQVAKEQVLAEWTQITLLALDPGGDRLFLAREAHRMHRVQVVDLKRDEVTRDIPLDLAPTSLKWDAVQGRLLVSHTYDDRVRSLDVETGQTLGLIPTALDLTDLAVDPERGHLLVTDSGGTLHILDGLSGEPIASLPAEGRIAVDSPHGRLYTGGEGADRVRVFDALALRQTGEIASRALPVADAFHGRLYLVQSGLYLASLETMTITSAISDTLAQPSGAWPKPYAVDAQVDAGSGRVYAIINNGVPGSNAGTHLYVYEPETCQKVLTDTERSPTYVDVDATTGRAYVSRIHMTARSTSLLVDGRQYGARLDSVFGALRVDPGLNRVYLSLPGEEEGQLLVLDAANLDVLGHVPIPGGHSLRGLDAQRHLLYLATRDNRVQIWSATGGEPATPVPPVEAHPSAQELFRLFLGPGDAPLFTGSLYRSEDRGHSWQSIRNGLPQRGILKLVASPRFEEDGVLFAATLPTDEGLGIWKSETAGWSWRMASRGLNDLAIHDLAISPNFAEDRTLFATTRLRGLFRSTDGGETWSSLTERYLPSADYTLPAGALFLSPSYEQDQILFVVHDGLWRSTDGGDTWVRSAADMASLAFSPGFAGDGILFGWSGSAGVLKSVDGGDTWQPASSGLTPSGLGSGRVFVPPDFVLSQTVYLLWSGGLPEEPVHIFRSINGAQTWEPLGGELPRAATAFELSADGSAFLALDESAQLIRWPVGEQVWVTSAPLAMGEIEIQRLVLSPAFATDRTLYAQSEEAGILRSADAGQSWSDTGFPLRVTQALPAPPVPGPGESLYLGTPLGLYRYSTEEGWAAVQGGLPTGIESSSPLLADDGSLVILSGSPESVEPQRLFLSTDQGRTWDLAVPPLPIAAAPAQLHLSPAFSSDRIAFLAPNWDRFWRTEGGAAWHTFGPDSEQGSAALHLSPAFDRDRMLFVQLADTRLWRSTDTGDSWVEVRGPWGEQAPMTVSAGQGYALGALTFSPAFAQDGVLLTQAGEALYRSNDLGASWSAVLELGPGQAQVVFGPDYERDGKIYLLTSRALFRSESRGQQWQPLPTAPWAALDDVTLLPSPSLAEDGALFAWTFGGGVYQSVDGGLSWQEIREGLPPSSIAQLEISPQYASDRLVFLVPHGPGLYRRAGEGPWLLPGETESEPSP